MPLRVTHHIRTPFNTTEFSIQPNNRPRVINQDYLAKLTDFLPDITYIVELENHKTTFVNKAFTKILGYAQTDLLDGVISWTDIIHLEDQKRGQAIGESIMKLADGATLEYEIRCKTINDKYIWLHNKLTVFTRDRIGLPEQVLVTSHDISYRKNLEEKLMNQLYTDQLTGIANRALFIEKLEYRIATKKMDFGLLFIDLNEFKKINDTHGHQIGDRVLMQAAKRLVGLFDPLHIVARLSGDEFTIIIDNCTKLDNLNANINSIHQEFIKEVQVDELQFSLCMSVGGILANNIKNPTCSLLLTLADKQMYKAKKEYYADKKSFRRTTRNLK